jgi:excisionase family DNA binding protein
VPTLSGLPDVRVPSTGSVSAAESGTSHDKPKNPRPGQLLTIDQLSEWLQVPKQTVYKWRSCGDGPRGYRIGKHVRFEVNEVERWLLAQHES